MNNNNTSSSLGKFIALSSLVTILLFVIGNRVFYADSNEYDFPFFSGLFSNSRSDTNTDDSSNNEDSEINSDLDEQETDYTDNESEYESEFESIDDESTYEEADDENDNENWDGMDSDSDDQPESGELDF